MSAWPAASIVLSVTPSARIGQRRAVRVEGREERAASASSFDAKAAHAASSVSAPTRARAGRDLASRPGVFSRCAEAGPSAKVEVRARGDPLRSAAR